MANIRSSHVTLATKNNYCGGKLIFVRGDVGERICEKNFFLVRGKSNIKIRANRITKIYDEIEVLQNISTNRFENKLEIKEIISIID